MAKAIPAKTQANGGVFTPHITLKNGRVIYAADYGLKAFFFTSKKPKAKAKQ